MEAMRQSLAEHEAAQRRTTQNNNATNTSSENPSNGAENESTNTHNTVSSTPLSFVLTQRHAAPSPRGSGFSTPDAGEGQPRSRTPAPGLGTSTSTSGASPLALAASQIALGLALPRAPNSGSIEAERATTAPTLPDQVRSRVAEAEPPSASGTQTGAGTVTGGEQVPVPDIEVVTGPQTENIPNEHGATGNSSGMASSSESTDRQRSNGEAMVEAEGECDGHEMPQTSAPVTQTSIDSATSALFDIPTPSTYKVLPSTPEDSIATQPLIQRMKVTEPDEDNSGPNS
jgi:hypothetical protein